VNVNRHAVFVVALFVTVACRTLTESSSTSSAATAESSSESVRLVERQTKAEEVRDERAELGPVDDVWEKFAALPDGGSRLAGRHVRHRGPSTKSAHVASIISDAEAAAELEHATSTAREEEAATDDGHSEWKAPPVIDHALVALVLVLALGAVVVFIARRCVPWA
jgi:hypothetical protein